MFFFHDPTSSWGFIRPEGQAGATQREAAWTQEVLRGISWLANALPELSSAFRCGAERVILCFRRGFNEMRACPEVRCCKCPPKQGPRLNFGSGAGNIQGAYFGFLLHRLASYFSVSVFFRHCMLFERLAGSNDNMYIVLYCIVHLYFVLSLTPSRMICSGGTLFWASEVRGRRGI